MLAAGLIAPGASPSEPSVQLVTFDDLQRRFGELHLRLLDARPQGEYDKGHIPGAVRVDAKAVEKMAAKPGALTYRTAWEAWIAPLGIGPDTEVLVYDANRQLDAAQKLSCHQEIAADGFFSLGMLADFEGPIHRHGGWFYRQLFWEAGIVGQMLYLEAEAWGALPLIQLHY